MSAPSPFGTRMGNPFPTMPKGESVASYETYPEAQSAVDALVKAEFPVNEVAIVGTDLRSIEKITGKLSWGRVALAGAVSGAWFGLFFGLLLFIFSPSNAALGVSLAAILIGAAFGMVAGLVSYALNRRRRDFTSVMQVLASRYAIVVEPQHASRAREVLGISPQPINSVSDGTAQTLSEDAAAAPRTYGEALDAARRSREQARSAAEQPTSLESQVRHNNDETA